MYLLMYLRHYLVKFHSELQKAICLIHLCDIFIRDPISTSPSLFTTCNARTYRNQIPQQFSQNICSFLPHTHTHTKSTLLDLIFTDLHCYRSLAEPPRRWMLKLSAKTSELIFTFDGIRTLLNFLLFFSCKNRKTQDKLKAC